MSVKDSILVAGVVLLKEKGIAALTQPQVARAAGIKQSHLTYYFPTRAELLLGVAESSISATMADIAARLAEKPQHATLAATVAEVMIAGVPPRIMIGLIVAADADPEIRKPLRKLIKHIRGQVQVVLAKAPELLEYMKTKLGINPGEVTTDGRFSLEEVECLAYCECAPALRIDGRYEGNLTREKIDQIIDGAR